MSEEKIITVSEIEDFDEVDIVEILVQPGDKVEKDQSICTLESDKAMMEFPVDEAGIIKSLAVSVGDKVKQGDPLLTLIIENEATSEGNDKPKQATKKEETSSQNLDNNETKSKKPKNKNVKQTDIDKAYASPAVRKYAGELGVNLDNVSGSGSKGRILKQDIQEYVKTGVSTSSYRSTDNQYALPDFSQFGEVEEKSLNKLRQVSAQHLHYSWSQVPHVTQFDDADITELESVRKELKQTISEQGTKLTLLPFVMKAIVKCLQEFPDFNSSVNQEVSALIHKKYFHIGIAVDTPRGLVVPVIKDVDKKKILQLAKELMEVSELARDNKLTPKDMQGGCMTITSLGGIGGKHFTPIINYPEVAILGVSRSQQELVRSEGVVEERLMLPLSLSYDHRAIDGVAAVKFITSLKNRLSDVWSLMI